MADDATRGVGRLNLDAAPFAPAPQRAVPAPNAGAQATGRGDRSRGRGRGGKGDSRGRGGGRSDHRNGAGNDKPPAPKGSGRGARNVGTQGPSTSSSHASSDEVPRRNGSDASGGKGVRADFLLNFNRGETPGRGGGFSANDRRRTSQGRGVNSSRGRFSSHSSSKNTHTKKYHRRGLFRKELFLAANFRFLIADWADLRGSSVDPDHVVDWDNVVLVEAGACDPLQCPICLDEPMTCSQVTLCGHSFCFPCVARHCVTNRKEGEPAKCPMCFEPLRLADLRKVRRRPIVAIGEDKAEGVSQDSSAVNKIKHIISMSLVTRSRDSAVPIAASTTRAVLAAHKARVADSQQQATDVELISPVTWPRSDFAIDGGACDAFAKYTLTSEEQSLGEEEMSTLEAKVHAMAAQGGMDAEQELPYILLACDAMQTRLSNWAEKRARFSGAPVPVPKVAGPARRDAMRKATEDVARKAAEAKRANENFPCLPSATAACAVESAAFLAGRAVQAPRAFTDDEDSEEEEETGSGNVGVNDGSENTEETEKDKTRLDSTEQSPLQSTDSPTAVPSPQATRVETYYFYQSSDGQPVVLHAVCLKLLLAEVGGSYENLPPTLSAPVVTLERWMQSEETRKRAAHLRHLPLTMEYTVVEVDLNGIVSDSVMREHGGEIRARAKLRQKALNAEKRKEASHAHSELQNRRNRRVFDPDVWRNMPELGAVTQESESTDSARIESSNNLSPSRALALAKAAAEREDALSKAESEAARLAFENAEGPRGTSFARVANLGFASGLDAPTLSEVGLEGDAFGPALGAAGNTGVGNTAPGVTNGNTWGPGVGRESNWGPGVEDVLTAAVADNPGGKKKGKNKGVVLSLTSGGRRY